MSEQRKTRLKTALGVTVTTVAPNDRGEVAVRLVTDLRPEEPFEAWLTAAEARDLAGQLDAQAGMCPRPSIPTPPSRRTEQMDVQAGYREEGRRAPEQPRPLFPRQPPAPNYTGTWMGWRWVNGRPTERAPAVER